MMRRSGSTGPAASRSSRAAALLPAQQHRRPGHAKGHRRQPWLTNRWCSASRPRATRPASGSSAGSTLLADAVASSVDEHARFGGVVPEVASRAHLEAMVPTMERACATPASALPDVDAIAVTAGPGLAGALLVGVAAAKAYAVAPDKPIYGVNHLAAHVAVDTSSTVPLPEPLIALLVSRRAFLAAARADDLAARRRAARRHDRRRRRRGVRQGGPAARPAVPGRPAYRPGGARRRPAAAIAFPRGLTAPRDLDGTASTSPSPG